MSMISHTKNDMSSGNLEKETPVILNPYVELSKLDATVADKITNAKTSGGRSLTAIWKSKLTNNEKIIMLFLGSELDFRMSFSGQYTYLSLNRMAENTSLNQSTICRILNGYRKRENVWVPGLIERGYIKKEVPTKIQQLDCTPTSYCLTSKVFDEYMMVLIKRTTQSKPNKTSREKLSGATTLFAPCNKPSLHHATNPLCTMQDILPSSSFRSPVCEEEKKIPHTQIVKEGKRSMTDGVSTQLCRTLSDTLKLRELFNMTYIANETCAAILTIVLNEAKISSHELYASILDLPNHPFDAVFKNRHIDIKRVSSELIRWLKERDLVLQEYQDKQELLRCEIEAKNAKLKQSYENPIFMPKEKEETAIRISDVWQHIDTQEDREKMQQVFSNTPIGKKSAFFQGLISPLTKEKVKDWMRQFGIESNTVCVSAPPS